jgi:hypothetical protein
VPANRTDEDFYRPFAELNLSPDTEIYLGLVHADGTEGVEQRMAMARRYVPAFGIATECGMARARTPNFVRNLLGIHAAVSREPAQGPGRA